VYCQVVYICGLIPARIRHALAELPDTLDETYERTLREINKAEWEIAHRLFQFVSVARRPLLVKELADLLAFDFEAGPIPKFHEEWHLEDPIDAVLSTCSSLLGIVDVKGSPVIQFSHFSVKEFLTSSRLAETHDIIPRRYHVSQAPAHTLAAKACLGILLYLDKDVVTSEGLERSPLAEYAAEYWADHARLDDVSQNVEDGMKKLFDPSKPHLSVCIWICDPNVLLSSRSPRVERPSALRGTFLHYAALWGLRSIVKFLVIEHSQNVHSQDFTDDVTPLQLASRNGHVEVVCFLLEHGADVTARDKTGLTPLHHASNNGQIEVIRILIKHGADVGAQNGNGQTPLHNASLSGQAGVVCILIEHGAVLSVQNQYGSTPLHDALRSRKAEVARILIDRGADVTVREVGGWTPLHRASREGQLEVARMLIERGADIADQTIKGQTPLHLAAEQWQLEVGRMLIERGVDMDAQTGAGETSLQYIWRCEEDIWTLLACFSSAARMQHARPRLGQLH
jgi:ankyrin repeat protein